jgi:hypothetical protein
VAQDLVVVPLAGGLAWLYWRHARFAAKRLMTLRGHVGEQLVFGIHLNRTMLRVRGRLAEVAAGGRRVRIEGAEYEWWPVQDFAPIEELVTLADAGLPVQMIDTVETLDGTALV